MKALLVKAFKQRRYLYHLNPALSSGHKQKRSNAFKHETFRITGKSMAHSQNLCHKVCTNGGIIDIKGRNKEGIRRKRR